MTYTTKLVNGIEVPLTQAEIDVLNAQDAAWLADSTNRLIADLTDRITKHTNDVAQAKTYDSALSCASYRDSSNAIWAAEAQAFIAWRDSVWSYAINYLEQVQTGSLPPPDPDVFMTLLPAITWP